MSNAINKDRKGYYKALEHTTGYIKKSNLLDITHWMIWFLTTLENSLDEALSSIEYIVQKTAFWDKYKDIDFNARQRNVLNAILDNNSKSSHKELSTKKYIKLAKTTSATASRDIKSLLSFGCIKQVEGTSGRNVRYYLVV